MEKILLAFDSDAADESVIEFACHLTRLTQSRLTGVFLEEPAIEEQIVVESETDLSGATSISITGIAERASTMELREENIRIFRDFAARADISPAIYVSKGEPATTLVAETRYADLLIIGADAFSRPDDTLPSSFARSLVHDAACPVVLAPEDFERIENIVFCYEGSKSSLFAIKQFSYLFPQLRSQRVKVISLDAEGPQPGDQARVTEWLRCHFSDVEWIARGEETAEALFHYLLRKRNDFVVMGPYGHGLLTSFFEPDYETGALRTTSLPIFIAHC